MSEFGELREKCLCCTACRLHETRTNVVFGIGNEKSPVLFIGEAPGANEDLQGEPFVGRSGKLLSDFLLAVGLSREKIYIANIVKCRPPENRDPLPDEEECCAPYLREQIRIMAPKLIVCLGRVAACKLIRPDFKITAERGSYTIKDGILMTATFHPAAVLRDPRKKSDMLSDFIEIKHRYDEFCS